MSSDCVVSFAWNVVKTVLDPIKDQFRYVTSPNSFADCLREEVRNLENEVQRVNVLAQRARNNVRNFYGVFTTWEKNSGDALKGTGDLLGDFEKATKTCCYGTLPNPKGRYRFSKVALGKIEVIRELAQKCRGFKELDDICFIDFSPNNVSAPNSAASAWTANEFPDDGLLESRAAILRNIVVALADDSNSVVGIYGMGGVGKSTLLVDAEKKIREEKQFDLIAKADVSQNPDIKRIQGEIADALSFSDIRSKESASGRAELLRRRLENEEKEKKKVLIILDNLWKGLDLKSIGIPCGHDNKVMGCKLLLTSRDRNILQREMGCDKDFPLDRLEEEEAKVLFEKMVGEKVHNDKFRPMVDEALRQCAGLPLLIVAMGKHLKHADLSEWSDALNQIKRSTDEGISGVINRMLQLSYDHLESEDAKSLLQLCVVYAVSEPSVENLVRYGYGWGLFPKNYSMEYARVRLNKLIHTLQASSLLLDNGGVDGFKIHDLVRNFVARFVVGDHRLLVLKDRDTLAMQSWKEGLKSYMSICFSNIDMKEFPKELDCPELRIFLLFTNNESLEVPDSFFNSMKKLAVLNLTRTRITRSPTPFQSLENLHTLCLQHCSLEDVAILGQLKRLQILSFVNSEIKQLPKEIEQLVELRLLDLNYCSKLQMIEPGVLGNLIKLEELYMENSFDQWNALEQTPPTNARLIELNNMKNLYTLQVSIPNPNVLPGDFDVEKLTKYKIKIGDVWRGSSHQGSSTLELKLDPISDILKKGCIQSIFGKTDDLFLDGMNESEQSICALSREGFPRLKHLQVENNPSVRYILQSAPHTYFKALESLLLKNLINLEKISNNNISSRSFSALKVVRVESCDKMEVLFPLSVMRELSKLEEIEVVGCKLMRGIVEATEGKVEFQNLHVLKLHDLPNIKNFFTVGTAPSSNTLDNQVSTQIAFFDVQQVAFPNLETLFISSLDNLEFMFFPSMAKSLAQLKNLTISHCKKMEAIITEEEGLGMKASETLTFQKLTDLRLEHLESLTCFSRGKCSQEARSQDRVHSLSTALFNREVVFPCLETLHIAGLDNIVMIWGDQVAADSLPKLKSLCVVECNRLVNVVPSPTLGWVLSLESLMVEVCHSLEVVFKLQPLNPPYGHPVACSPLKELKLNYLPKLKCVWDKELHHQVKFEYLRSVSISKCESLTSLFSTLIAGDLVELAKLRIGKCELLTEVISGEGGGEGHVVAFNQLKYIELDGLTELRCFSSGGHTLMFPLLEDVIVAKCLNMKSFSEGPIEAPKLKRVRESRDAGAKQFWKENLNITIQNRFEEMAKFMRLFEFPELIGKWHSKLNPIKSSWQLKGLVVDKCPSFINALPSKLMLVLEKMTSLQVCNCDSLEEIFDLNGLEVVESSQVLPKLDQLNLVNLPKLRQLWNKDLQGTIRFNSLYSLTLHNCSDLRHAFTPSMARCLATLALMEIKECVQMEGTIVEEEGLGSALKKITFPKLQWIKLECLPNLTSFLSGKNHTLDCPKMRYLTIAHCPNMRSLTWQSSMDIDQSTPSLFTPQVQFPELESVVLSHRDKLSKIWTEGPQETLPFDNLWEVKFQNCKSLENLFPHWMAISLTKLEKLRVESCVIEEIVVDGDDTPHSNTAHVVFPKLTSLVLHDMPRLKSFCPNLPTLNWPHLKELRLTHCDKVDMLSFVTSMNKWTQRDDQQDLSNQEAHSSFEMDFPNLERLLLVNKDIQMIQDGNFPDDIFGKPKALTLACFHDEKAVFPPIVLLERFQNLESLEIFCSSFEDIFPNEGLVVEGKHSVLENLRELKLSKLHNLKRVWREDYLIGEILQSIVTFEVWDCPCLTTIFPAVTSFQNLRELVVKNSSGLVHLVTVSAVTNLVHLTNMTIIGCEKMKEVVANDGNGEGKVIYFKKLECLRLQNLPSLECFSSITSCSLRFPSLLEIEVEECPKMNIFSKGMLSTPELRWMTLFRYRRQWNWECDLNTEIQSYQHE